MSRPNNMPSNIVMKDLTTMETKKIIDLVMQMGGYAVKNLNYESLSGRGSDGSVVTRRAFLGESFHILDIKTATMMSSIGDQNLQVYCSDKLNEKSIASYMRLFREAPDNLLGLSDAHLATAFRALYSGYFRLQYLSRSYSQDNQIFFSLTKADLSFYLEAALKNSIGFSSISFRHGIGSFRVNTEKIEDESSLIEERPMIKLEDDDDEAVNLNPVSSNAKLTNDLILARSRIKELEEKMFAYDKLLLAFKEYVGQNKELCRALVKLAE